MTPRHDDLIFLCGPLRSGTTLTRLLLQQHPQVSTRGESDYYFDDCADALRRGSDTPEDRARFAYGLRHARIPQHQGVRPVEPAPLREMIDALLRQERPAEGRFLLTLHRHADLAATLFPEAAFVRLRRDPRDVAISAMKMGWAGNPYYGVDVWRRSERDWHAAEPLMRGPKVEIGFEEMTADPRGELGRVLEAIGLPFDEAVLAPPADSTYSAPTAGRNQAWRGALSEREAREVDWRARDVPDDGRYERRPEAPSAVRRAALLAEDKARRQAFGIGRYGLPLYAAEKATRWLNLPGREAVRRRVHAVDTTHLK